MSDEIFTLFSSQSESQREVCVPQSETSLPSLEHSNTPIGEKFAILLLEILSIHTQNEGDRWSLQKLNMGLIGRVLTRDGIDIETRLISMRLNWKKAVGETYFQATVPDRYDKRSKKLYLHVKNSTWANHLHMTRTSFIKTLNEKLPDFQIQDILAQFRELTRRNWKQYAGKLAGVIRRNYRLQDQEALLLFLNEKQQVQKMTKEDRDYCRVFLRKVLTRQYADNPLIRELVLFNAPTSFLNLAEDWEVRQEILRQELLQKVDREPLPRLNQDTLQGVSDTSLEIPDSELRTAFTELMSFAKRSGLEDTAQPGTTSCEPQGGDS